MTSATSAAPGSEAGSRRHLEPPETRASRIRLGRMLVGMAILHVVVPGPFEKIVPKRLGHPRFFNLAAAAAEGASGALLLSHDPRWRRAGGALATATIVGVYPANISMALEAGRPRSLVTLAPWLRLPLQFPMIAWAWRHAKGPDLAR